MRILENRIYCMYNLYILEKFLLLKKEGGGSRYRRGEVYKIRGEGAHDPSILSARDNGEHTLKRGIDQKRRLSYTRLTLKIACRVRR